MSALTLERSGTKALATHWEVLPALFTPTPAAPRRTLELFTANVGNPNTRKSYACAVRDLRLGAG